MKKYLITAVLFMVSFVPHAIPQSLNDSTFKNTIGLFTGLGSVDMEKTGITYQLSFSRELLPGMGVSIHAGEVYYNGFPYVYRNFNFNTIPYQFYEEIYEKDKILEYLENYRDYGPTWKYSKYYLSDISFFFLPLKNSGNRIRLFAGIGRKHIDMYVYSVGKITRNDAGQITGYQERYFFHNTNLWSFIYGISYEHIFHDRWMAGVKVKMDRGEHQRDSNFSGYGGFGLTFGYAF